MVEITVPRYRALALEQLVLDFNGTLACDGEPNPFGHGGLSCTKRPSEF